MTNEAKIIVLFLILFPQIKPNFTICFILQIEAELSPFIWRLTIKLYAGQIKSREYSGSYSSYKWKIFLQLFLVFGSLERQNCIFASVLFVVQLFDRDISLDILEACCCEASCS